jgi:hypothetical protein
MPPEKEGRAPRRTDIDLQPGVNPVHDDQWAKAKEVKVVNALLSAGKLSELGPTQDGSLKDVQEGQALKLVPETYNLKLLGAWLIEEKRPKVKAAIQKQLDTIERESRPEKEDR